MMMHKNKSVNAHNFAMIPRADIPRSAFRQQSTHKTTFNGGDLIPIYIDEVLPGDTMKLRMTAFGRLATPITPVMDNLWLETFWFFVPNRLIWDNWQKFMGEQTNPGDSTSYVIPQRVCPAGGYQPLTIYDYMGLPTAGQITGANTYSHNTLPLRAYNLIWNEWFRDENLQNAVSVPTNDGPDNAVTYAIKKRGKRHDYFTSALPWPQKGASVMLPLGTQAPVITNNQNITMNTAGDTTSFTLASATAASGGNIFGDGGPGGTHPTVGGGVRFGSSTGLVADLSAATAATINQIRQSFQVQKLLERDARGGTRYTEILLSHFGVRSPDARLQRPEYLGGGRQLINMNPVAQTSATTSGGVLGELSGVGTVLKTNDGFSQSFVEHGYIIGLMNVRADITYQQGLRKMWSRSTRYDFYFPVFAHLGEQAILNKEIYSKGVTADNDVFGYQERWAEYRYRPSMITGLFRSTNNAPPIDFWHYAQLFTTMPTLNSTFIEDPTQSVIERTTAVGSAAGGQQLIMDMFFDNVIARSMPMYSVPGLIDHF